MHVGPVIAVTDLARARRFYEGALELDDHETPGGWVVSADEGTVVYVLADIPDCRFCHVARRELPRCQRASQGQDPDGSILTVFQLSDAP